MLNKEDKGNSSKYTDKHKQNCPGDDQFINFNLYRNMNKINFFSKMKQNQMHLKAWVIIRIQRFAHLFNCGSC